MSQMFFFTIRNDIVSISLNRLFGNAVLENHNNYFISEDDCESHT